MKTTEYEKGDALHVQLNTRPIDQHTAKRH